MLLLGGYYWMFSEFVSAVDRACGDTDGLGILVGGFALFYLLAFALLGVSIYVTIAAAKIYVSAQRPYYRDSGAMVIAVIAMLYWPIGIWFLQPKINVLAQAADDYARTGVPPLPAVPQYY